MHCIQAHDTQMAIGVFEKEDRSFPPGQPSEKAVCDDQIRLIARKWILATGIGQFTEHEPSPNGFGAEFIAHAAGFIIRAAGNEMPSRRKVRIGGR